MKEFVATCEYCGTPNVLTGLSVYQCQKCGGPLRPPDIVVPADLTRAAGLGVMDTGVYGIDVSQWQGEMDWQKARAAGIAFAYIKATDGAAGLDPQYQRNRAECERLGIPFGTYHFFKPDKDFKKQAIHAATFAAGALPLAVDLETDGGLDKAGLEDVLAKFIMRVEEILSEPVVIYTRATFFDTQMPLTNFAWRKLLWVAHYTSAAAPAIPKEWSNHSKAWTFWQYSADGNLRGAEFGAASKSIDINRYNGSLADFEKQFKVTVPVPVPTPEPGIPAFVRVTAAALNIRNAPLVEAGTDIGDLHQGALLPVVSDAGDWWEVKAYVSKKYVQKV